MTQGSDDEGSKPGTSADGGWDELLGDSDPTKPSPAAPAPPVPLTAPITVPVDAPASSAPSLFAPPSLSGKTAAVEETASDDDTAQAGARAETETETETETESTAAPASAAAPEIESKVETAAESEAETEAESEAETEAETEAESEDTASRADEPDEARPPVPAAQTAQAPGDADAASQRMASGTESGAASADDAETAAEASGQGQSASTQARPRAATPKLDPGTADAHDVEDESAGWLWIVGIAAVAVFGFFVFRSGAAAHDAPQGHGASDRAAADEAAEVEDHDGDDAGVDGLRRPALRGGATPEDPTPAAEAEAAAPAVEPSAGEDTGDTEGEAAAAPADALAPAADGDPRSPPPGTNAANAAALARIPVAQSDRGPVAGVGANGIHVDAFDLGDGYEGRRCVGAKDAFSVGAGQKVNACLRVVHQREVEQVVVEWMKDGELVRRNKVKVPDAHAYRTRASLAPNETQLGAWTVRVVSSDDVVLASAGFSVVE